MVTEYITNGNLNDVLHRDNIAIPLDIRLRIARECAEALAYMHSHMYTQVIHGDIKPANILLDGNFHAKISDFGISSFGVVLFKLITRKKATAAVGEVNIVYVFTNALARGVRMVREMFDAEIASQSNMKILEGIAKLAGECLRMERDRRPEMTDVAERIRMLRKLSHQGKQRVDLFSWVRKSKPAPLVPAIIHTESMPSALRHLFSWAEMKIATNNFDQSLLVSEDVYCRIYHGVIDGGATKVVIKRFWHMYDDRGRGREFHTEVEKRFKLCHLNLVPLIGYCDESEFIIVYNYIAHGNLRDHLYRTHGPPLTCKQRLEICIGAARGLNYLHRGAEHTIIHGDVELKAIFLDEELVAKISHNIQSGPCNRTIPIGFWKPFAPEYMMTGRLTQKSDVYSFRIVLFEVLCARPVLDRKRPKEQVDLLHWALRCQEEGSPYLIVDPYLKGKIKLQCLNKFLETALKCVAMRCIDRPSMEDVLSGLEYALQLQESTQASQ
ncbi:hypothetical protein ACP70R_012273 [Stipagrostis hirtigluma subsp. patula]